ncbi:hypothetical protein BDY24DRAFT_415391 [Mrakia frigida]|uniref:uncharacterized protein n=1 Tax=Mrakia frigida TaxID=29902 RepID=UPI003FCC0901
MASEEVDHVELDGLERSGSYQREGTRSRELGRRIERAVNLYGKTSVAIRSRRFCFFKYSSRGLDRFYVHPFAFEEGRRRFFSFRKGSFLVLVLSTEIKLLDPLQTITTPRREQGADLLKPEGEASAPENIPRGINKRQLEKHFQGLRFSRIDLWQKEDRSFIAEVVLSCPSEARLAVQRLHEPKTILSPHPITDPSTQTRSSFDSKFDLNRLFIPSLDSLVSGAQLRELFSRFGTVRSCVAVVKYGTKNHYQAFVTYENPQDAYAALKATDGQLIGSWKTSVKFALLDKKAQPPILKPKQTKGRDAIFTLFGLSHLTSSEDLRETFSKHGEVSKVHIPASTNGNPSFIMGFVRFKNQWDVAHARLALNGSTLRSARIRVTTAQTELS